MTTNNSHLKADERERPAFAPCAVKASRGSSRANDSPAPASSWSRSADGALFFVRDRFVRWASTFLFECGNKRREPRKALGLGPVAHGTVPVIAPAPIIASAPADRSALRSSVSRMPAWRPRGCGRCRRPRTPALRQPSSRLSSRCRTYRRRSISADRSIGRGPLHRLRTFAFF